MEEMFTMFLGTGVWAVIKAVLILILAFIVSAIVKTAVIKLLARTRLTALMARNGGDGTQMETFIGNLTHLLVFLLFVPGIFGSLGMEGISQPIMTLLNTMWGYVPNLIAAGVILWVGLFIAKLVRGLLTPVFDKLNLNRLQEKAGIEAAETANLSHTLAYIIYVLILIPVFITALQALNIAAVSEPAVRMLDMVFGFIPNIFAALVIILLGCMIARLTGGIVENLIASAGLDARMSKLLETETCKFTLSKVVGTTVHGIMVLFFAVEGISVLRLEVLSRIGDALIGYLPYVLAACLILAVCYICDAAAQKALAKNGHTGYAVFARCAIYVVGGFMILNELGIAPELVNATFILIAAAAALAFALAFGIGGREFAGKVLEKLEHHKENDV